MRDNKVIENMRWLGIYNLFIKNDLKKVVKRIGGKFFKIELKSI